MDVDYYNGRFEYGNELGMNSTGVDGCPQCNNYNYGNNYNDMAASEYYVNNCPNCSRPVDGESSVKCFCGGSTSLRWPDHQVNDIINNYMHEDSVRPQVRHNKNYVYGKRFNSYISLQQNQQDKGQGQEQNGQGQGGSQQQQHHHHHHHHYHHMYDPDTDGDANAQNMVELDAETGFLPLLPEEQIQQQQQLQKRQQQMALADERRRWSMPATTEGNHFRWYKEQQQNNMFLDHQKQQQAFIDNSVQSQQHYQPVRIMNLNDSARYDTTVSSFSADFNRNHNTNVSNFGFSDETPESANGKLIEEIKEANNEYSTSMNKLREASELSQDSNNKRSKEKTNENVFFSWNADDNDKRPNSRPNSNSNDKSNENPFFNFDV